MGFTSTDSRMIVVNVIEYPNISIDSFDFPTKAVINEWKPFRIKAKVTKAGAGNIALGITNAAGSPSSIIIKYGGKEHTLRPNENFLAKNGGADYTGKTYEISGSVKFTKGGNYTIVIFTGYTL